MDKWQLWHAFMSSGRVEDYLRYRGVDLPGYTAVCKQEEGQAYGDRPKTASDDRRPDSAGV
ncbi:MAG: hypothetical protein IJ518_06160 [Clostridia bacterium]|nr:hypothetical protein [Clostridia bacterium]